MATELPVVCNQCEEELGDPDNEVAHPDDPDAPDDAHFTVQIREDGEERLQCTVTGRLARPVGPDDEDYPFDTPTQEEGPPDQPQSQEPEPEGQAQPRPPQDNSPVFDLEEDKSQMDILYDVVSNPHYGLDQEQVGEVKAWAEDYDGQMPPDVLEDLVRLMDGVSKQTAKLVRRRYELKLNKWVRNQTQEEEGPPIGFGANPYSGAQMGSSPSRSSRSHNRPSPKAQREQKEQEEQDRQQQEEQEESRREKRVSRRREAVDNAMDELAMGTAENLSSEAGQGLIQFRNIGLKVLEAKAEKDPDWFFELADRLDIDPMMLLEPSEARKKEMQEERSQTQSAVDAEVQDAIPGNSSQQQSQQQQREPQTQQSSSFGGTADEWPDETETDKYDTQQEQPADTLEHEEDDGTEDDDEGEDMFEEVFGE